MAAGIDIGIGANTNDFERGIKQGVVKPLEGIEDVLKDVQKAGDRAGEDLEKSMKDAAEATEKNEKANKELADTVKKVGRAGKDSGDDFKQGTDKAKGGLDEVGREAESTAKESAASFDGSAESIADAFQEVAANAFAGFGPAGLIAGAAIAVVMGTAMAAAQGQADAINEAKEKVNDLTQSIIAAGGDIKQVDLAGIMQDWALEIRDNREWWELWQDDAVNNMDHVQDKAKELGIDTAKMFRAMSGQDADAAAEVLEILEGKYDDLIKKRNDAGDETMYVMYDREATAVRGLSDEVERNNGITEKAKEQAKILAQATREQAEATKRATEAAELQTDIMGTVSEAYDSTRDAAVNAAYGMEEAEEKAFDISRWMDYVAEHKAQVEQYNANLEGMRLSDDEWANFLELPENVRMSIAESYGAAGEDGKTRIRETLSDGGAEAGKGATTGFDENFNPEADLEIVATANTSKAQDQIADVAEGDYNAKVKVTTFNKAAAVGEVKKVAHDDYVAKVKVTTNNKAQAISEVKRVAHDDYEAKVKVTTNNKANAINEIEKVAKNYTANVKVNASTGDAERAISNLTRNRTVTITAKVVDKNGKRVD